jgi:hypothetical protein
VPDTVTSDRDVDLIVVAQVDEPTRRLAQAAYRIATSHSLALALLVLSASISTAAYRRT